MATTVLIGLVVALLYAEVTGLLPGGIIVPAGLALYAGHPVRIAATLGAALIALGIFRLLSARFLIFGRRRFVFLILLGGMIGQIWLILWPGVFPGSLDMRVIGWIIPGLLANTLARQKFWPTLASLAAATATTAAIARILFKV
jgi:gamma-polyglutamate biosynthesis protein CapC